jgi:hypothetical protein
MSISPSIEINEYDYKIPLWTKHFSNSAGGKQVAEFATF